MSDIDEFATSLLDESKRFLEKAEETKDKVIEQAYLHAAIMVGFSALEAHINSVADDFAHSDRLTIHERAVLQEQDVRLENGMFTVGGLKIYRLEDRLDFLFRKFSGEPTDIKPPWASALGAATKLRNELTHPKKVPVITPHSVTQVLEAVISTIDSLYMAVYRKKFPAAGRGLQSRFTF